MKAAPLVLALHAVTALAGVALCVTGPAGAGALVLCMSALFLMVAKVDALLDTGQGRDAQWSLDAQIGGQRDTLLRVERRCAALGELVRRPGVGQFGGRVAWLLQRVHADDQAVDLALQQLRDDVLAVGRVVELEETS